MTTAKRDPAMDYELRDRMLAVAFSQRAGWRNATPDEWDRASDETRHDEWSCPRCGRHSHEGPCRR